MKKQILPFLVFFCVLTGVFSDALSQSPINDDCSGAINIPTNGSGNSIKYPNIGATLSMPACSGTANKDIWFKFTATASRHQVISRVESASHIVEVFQGTCGNLTSILCRDSPNNTAELVNLIPGQTYYYRLYLKNGDASTVDFTTYITSWPMPVNDEPTGATPLTINTTFNGSLEYATQSFAPCFNTGYDAKDVWYKFIATGTAHNIALSPVSFNESMFQIYSGTPGNLTSIHCSGITGYEKIKTAELTNLAIGNTYYMRVHNRYGDASPSVTYKIDVKTSNNTLANDDCSGAINIPTNGSGNSIKYPNIGATLSMPACSGTANKDIWFKFTATASRHQVISRVESASHIVEVFQGTCGNLTSILCRDSPNNTAELVNLIPGQTYYYRLYLKNGDASTVDFTTYITSWPMPVNDEPTGATPLTINTTFNGSLEYATQSFAPCFNTGYDAKDVWYKFIATGTAHNIALSPVSFNESMFQIYSGTPGNLTSIHCSGITGYEKIKTAELTNLAIGNTYYMRVHNRYGDASPSVTYKIDVKTSNNTLANDDCSGAINIPTNGSGNSIKYPNIGATLSMPACSGTANKDIWFKFTATASRHQVISRVESASHIVEVFQGTCGNLTSILCRDSPNNTAELVNLIPGQTYYYRLYLKNGDASTVDFTTYITSWPMPVNDEPTGATPLTINTTFNGSLEYATQSFAPCFNTGYDAKDVWYKFIATGTAHNIALSPVSFNESMFQIYSGTPGNLTSIHCSGITGYEKIKTVELTNLAIGNTYYMRVHNRYGDASPSVTYKIDVIYVQTPPPTIIGPNVTEAVTGSVITIKGTNFYDVLSVTFGGIPAQSFTVVAPDAITAILSSEAISGEIEVKTKTGAAKFSGFVVVSAPVLTANGQTTFATGSNVLLTANLGTGYNYKWYKDNILIIGTTGASLTVAESGSYAVSVILNNEESKSNTIVVSVIFTLPPNNFRIQLNGTTCKTSNNGSVNITSVQSKNYTATISGPELNSTHTFTSALEIKDLRSGTYNICIYIEGQPTYKQCYDVVVTEPKDLAVYTSVNKNNNTVNLNMNGGISYVVKLNGETYNTTESQISLQLKKGVNELQIVTDKPCQGMFNKTINLEGVLVYPNPFENELNISTSAKNAVLEIVNLEGRKVFSQKKVPENGKITINLSHLLKGIYVLDLNTDGTKSLHKIIKK